MSSYITQLKIYSTFDAPPKLVSLHELKVSGLIEAKQRGVEVAKSDEPIIDPDNIRTIIKASLENSDYIINAMSSIEEAIYEIN